MDTIQLSDINEYNTINDTLETRNTHQNAADYVHYVEYLEETTPESKLKNVKIIFALLLTVIIVSFVANVILTAAILSKYYFLNQFKYP